MQMNTLTFNMVKRYESNISHTLARCEQQHTWTIAKFHQAVNDGPGSPHNAPRLSE